MIYEHMKTSELKELLEIYKDELSNLQSKSSSDHYNKISRSIEKMEKELTRRNELPIHEFDMSNKELIEQLADKQHEIWSHCMQYQFSQCTQDENGNLVIPKEKVERWKRQMNTPYYELTEKEKQSYRDQVNKFIHLISS